MRVVFCVLYLARASTLCVCRVARYNHKKLWSFGSFARVSTLCVCNRILLNFYGITRIVCFAKILIFP